MTNIVKFPAPKKKPQTPTGPPVKCVTFQRIAEGALIARYVHGDESSAVALFEKAMSMFNKHQYKIWLTKEEVEQYACYVSLGDSQQCKDGLTQLHTMALRGDI